LDSMEVEHRRIPVHGPCALVVAIGLMHSLNHLTLPLNALASHVS
jgi:hypothetical protein